MIRLELSVPLVISVSLAAIAARRVDAQQRRARPPVYHEGQFEGIFATDVSQLVRPDRPRVDQLGGSGEGAASAPAADSTPVAAGAGGGGADAGQGRWSPLADPVNLEDEVKRIKLHYDSVVTTPGRFKSGDFQLARSDLSMLATLMAVIAEYEGNVRFKEDAAMARDLLARSAVNVAGGSSEAFAEAKQRKADLQDLVSGGGLNRTAPSAPVDWSIVTTRPPLMEHLEALLNDPLQSETGDAESVSGGQEDLLRAAGIVAVLAEVLNQEGMEGADDAEYRQLAEAMKNAALLVRAAVQKSDAEAARLAVGELSQTCVACHDHYR